MASYFRGVECNRIREQNQSQTQCGNNTENGRVEGQIEDAKTCRSQRSTDANKHRDLWQTTPVDQTRQECRHNDHDANYREARNQRICAEAAHLTSLRSWPSSVHLAIEGSIRLI